VSNKEVGEPESRSFRDMAGGPQPIVKRMNAFVTNGYRFHTSKRVESKKIQNFGVMAKTESKTYDGKIIDIIELDYYSKCNVVLF